MNPLLNIKVIYNLILIETKEPDLRLLFRNNYFTIYLPKY